MTTKTFDALVPGDFVADMHDGMGPIRKRFGVVEWIQWRTGPRTGDRALDRAMGADRTFNFPNKELRVLGERTGANHEGQLVCGYDYDGELSGLVVLAEYVTGSDPRD